MKSNILLLLGLTGDETSYLCHSAF